MATLYKMNVGDKGASKRTTHEAPSQEPLLEEAQAIMWQLGIESPKDSLQTEQVSKQIWSDLCKKGCREQVLKICQFLATSLAESIQIKFNLRPARSSAEGKLLESLYQSFISWANTDETSKKHVRLIIKQALKEVQSQYTASETLMELEGSDAPASPALDAPETDKSSPTLEATIVSAQGKVPPLPTSVSPATGTASTISAPNPPETSSVSLEKETEPTPQPSHETQQANAATKPVNQPPTSSQEITETTSVSHSANPTPETGVQQPRNEAASPPVASHWKYLPPSDEPDASPEYHRDSRVSPEGLKLMGARVRGKKHKHEGTHCDDWFKFTVSGPWTIIAVSDGAGSKKFSRVGAKVSCEATVEHLATSLEAHSLTDRDADEWAKALQRNENGNFAGEDIERVQDVLHKAMLKAYDAVERAAAERSALSKYYKILGRDLEVKDLSATLLLAVHTLVKSNDSDRSFVLTCHVGDGMMAVAYDKGGLQLVGDPEKGEFAGETDFLTTKKMREGEMLRRKTFGSFGSLRALMLMTDGVADDYFPNDPNLLRLYGDLVLNQVIPIKGPNEKEIAKALSSTKLPTLDDVAKATLDSHGERITQAGAHRIPIRTVAAYAEKLGLDVSAVVKSPALLLAGGRGSSMCDSNSPEERLEVWLDSYYVQGSFDDRTLVVLYQEVVS